MAAVIRDARIEPERMLLAVVARTPPASVRRAQAAAAPAQATAEPVWTEPAPGPGPAGADRQLDPLAQERAFRERLDAERLAVLEQAEADGYAAGLQRGEAAFAERLDALTTVIASARAALESGIAETEDVMVEIAFEAVCRILGDAMQHDAAVVAVVREILGGMRERERLLVRVSPVDYEILERHRAQLLQGEDGRTIDLVADERVVLGGCLVETTGGTLDGRLETQLQRLVDTLSSARRMQGEGMP